MNKPRRHFLGTEKVAILKRHLIDKVPVSDLCDELDIHATQIYDWLKKFFEKRPPRLCQRGRKSKADEDAKGRGKSKSSKPNSHAKTRSWPSSWRPRTPF